MLPEVSALIKLFNLKPLAIENTLFAQTYVSEIKIGDHPISTAMIGLYCETPLSVSLFHRLTIDEVWHYYAGDPFRLILLYPDGSTRDVIMGNDLLHGHHVQFVVPANVWQAARMIEGGRYSLYGCTLAPGFTEDIFQPGLYDQLVATYPDRADDLKILSSDGDLAKNAPTS